MIHINFEEALTIIDFDNPMFRVYNKYPEHQLLGIANTLMKKRGLEWVFLTLAHDETLKKIAKQAMIDKKNNLSTTYNSDYWVKKRREANEKYHELSIQVSARHAESLNKKYKNSKEQIVNNIMQETY